MCERCTDVLMCTRSDNDCPIKRGLNSIPAADVVEVRRKLQSPRWIPVTERLPEEDGMYLVHGKWSASGRKVTDTCEFYVHDGYFRAAWNFDVTHWMPLPEPPKEEQR